MEKTVKSRFLEGLILQEEERLDGIKGSPRNEPSGLQSAICDTQSEIAKAFAESRSRRIRARPSRQPARTQGTTP